MKNFFKNFISFLAAMLSTATVILVIVAISATYLFPALSISPFLLLIVAVIAVILVVLDLIFNRKKKETDEEVVAKPKKRRRNLSIQEMTNEELEELFRQARMNGDNITVYEVKRELSKRYSAEEDAKAELASLRRQSEKKQDDETVRSEEVDVENLLKKYQPPQKDEESSLDLKLADLFQQAETDDAE